MISRSALWGAVVSTLLGLFLGNTIYQTAFKEVPDLDWVIETTYHHAVALACLLVLTRK